MNTDHQAIVPPWAGRPWCTCGYVGGNGIDRPLLADHLREVKEARKKPDQEASA